MKRVEQFNQNYTKEMYPPEKSFFFFFFFFLLGATALSGLGLLL
jgi:hypothetical protein